ncbi:MAG TPA: FHA domain-containing protein [Polyangiaceae bacterium]|nr:FHA domain-containing protein [Polyangiaceae bacterium]
MARLLHRRTQELILVEPELLIGRSAACGLRIREPYVSAQHASLRWSGWRWEIKDLGSRNGTFLNGARVEVGRAHPVERNGVLGFGSESEAWVLSDDSAPEAMAIPLDGGEPVTPENDMIALPSLQSPEASIFRDADGLWKLENLDGERIVLEHHKLFQVGGHPWRFASPDIIGPSSSALVPSQARPLKLRFSVSPDEEYVEIRAEYGSTVFDLGSRSHNYLLLTLARVHLEDSKNGLPPHSCGWIHQEDLLQKLHITQTQLNIDVFRIRQHFAKVGIPGNINVIERRPRNKQLRLGIAVFDIEVA